MEMVLQEGVARGSFRCGEFHRSNRTQAPIGGEGRPSGQMRSLAKRLPGIFRRPAQFCRESDGPLLSVLSYLRPAGAIRSALLAIGHLLLVFLFVSVDWSMTDREQRAPD